MNKTLWTSDSHFRHRNILKYSARNFPDIETHDEALIQKWNSVVGENDTVYHLGDFAMGKGRGIDHILCRLNGEKHFVWGNHDTPEAKASHLWASSQPYLELSDGKDFIVMSHYSHRVWNRSHHGSLMLYGHSHNSLPGNSQSCDVGVDCWDYTPVTLAQIKERLATLPPYRSVDHHQARA